MISPDSLMCSANELDAGMRKCFGYERDMLRISKTTDYRTGTCQIYECSILMTWCYDLVVVQRTESGPIAQSETESTWVCML